MDVPGRRCDRRSRNAGARTERRRRAARRRPTRRHGLPRPPPGAQSVRPAARRARRRNSSQSPPARSKNDVGTVRAPVQIAQRFGRPQGLPSPQSFPLTEACSNPFETVRTRGHLCVDLPRGRTSPRSCRSPEAPSANTSSDTLTRAPGRSTDVPVAADDPLGGDDLHLALYLCYELHYRGFDRRRRSLGMGPRAAAAPSAARGRFRRRARRRGAGAAGRWGAGRAAPDRPGDRRRWSVAFALSGDHGTADQFREFIVHRSAYQLKEADPHSWAIPRLWGGPKAALHQDPVRGVRRGGCRRDALVAVREHDARARPRSGSTVPTST